MANPFSVPIPFVGHISVRLGGRVWPPDVPSAYANGTYYGYSSDPGTIGHLLGNPSGEIADTDHDFRVTWSPYESSINSACGS